MLKRIATLAVLIVVTIVAISLFLAPNNLMNCDETPSSKKGCTVADAIVAVSGGDTSARAQEAIKLYQQGWGKKLIFAGAAYDKTGPSNAEVMKQQAIEQGIPAAQIIIEEKSETTRENAEKTKTIFDQYHIKTAIVVTSGYHQKRTILEFRERAPEVTFRSYPVSSDRHWSVWWWTTPNGWYLAITEVIKIVVFYFGGTR